MMAGADEPATLSGLCQRMAIAMASEQDESIHGRCRRRSVALYPGVEGILPGAAVVEARAEVCRRTTSRSVVYCQRLIVKMGRFSAAGTESRAGSDLNIRKRIK